MTVYVLDKYHLTGVSFDGYPGERDVTITPQKLDKVPSYGV